MDFRTALIAIANRVSSTTPLRDARMRYRHDSEDRLADTPDDRIFTVSPGSLRWYASPADGQIVEAEAHISVLYSRSPGSWKTALDASEDAEQLFHRLAYKPGQEWQADLAVEVIATNIKDNTIEISVLLHWTSTSTR